MSEIWSNTDFPYMCLKDEKRTLAFRDAISAQVRPGDVVVDVGAGSGILSLFAAAAGASRVYAVEIDPHLAEALRVSVKLNDFDEVIDVVEGDVLTVPLPSAADVVVTEMIETGLLDEQQVPALNHLWAAGVISPATRLVPERYTTTFQLVNASHDYYGFSIVAPKHEWPFYGQGEGWHPTAVVPAGDPQTIALVDFTRGPIEDLVRGRIDFDLQGRSVNAVRLAGLIGLAPGLDLGPTHAVNGDKLIAIPPLEGIDAVRLEYSFQMGAGLSGLSLTCAPWQPSVVARR